MIQPILDKALAGERLTSEDATALLESNDFVRIGLAADEIRQRKNPDDAKTTFATRADGCSWNMAEKAFWYAYFADDAETCFIHVDCRQWRI